ncbi:hypothetical protein V8G54_034097 [Vigna mungo]|uniref:DRBM domain-containing protein n=1 Tax=Vigna mungo TaxID=3915 RepID=A0AAQ3MQZ2_VIGMU
MDCIHKIQLQNNARMNNLDPPVFACKTEELPPAIDFKATLLVDGHSIESPSVTNTIKETERASDLMSLSPDIFEKGDSDSFKTSIMKLTEREGFHKPTYKTMQAGCPYMPTFFSTLEVEGVEFHGKGCRSKREAEEDAAKIAYIALKKCGLSMYAVFSPSPIEHKAVQSILGSDIVKCIQNLKLEGMRPINVTLYKISIVLKDKFWKAGANRIRKFPSSLFYRECHNTSHLSEPAAAFHELLPLLLAGDSDCLKNEARG